jgi:Tfp pilus assembly protein PilE
MKAFSLIELIFVIVIMGVMTFVGMQYIPNEKVYSYTQMLKAKILEKKSNALGYKSEGNESYFCIKFDKDSLQKDEENSKVRYDFNKSYISIEVTPELNNSTLCFDYMGRDFNGSVNSDLTNLLHQNIIITIKNLNNNLEENITVFPISGTVR